MLVARHQAARARMELLRGVRGDPDQERSARPRRPVAELLHTAAELRAERRRRAEAEAAREALRQQQREAARQRRLDELARDPETAWARAGELIGTKVPARYDDAVTLLVDLRDLARRDGRGWRVRKALRRSARGALAQAQPHCPLRPGRAQCRGRPAGGAVTGP